MGSDLDGILKRVAWLREVRGDIVAMDRPELHEGIGEVRGFSEKDATACSVAVGWIALRRLGSEDVRATRLGAASGRALDRVSMGWFHNYLKLRHSAESHHFSGHSESDISAVDANQLVKLFQHRLNSSLLTYVLHSP